MVRKTHVNGYGAVAPMRRAMLPAVAVALLASALAARPAQAAMQDAGGIRMRTAMPASLDTTVRRLVEELEGHRKRELELVKMIGAARGDSSMRRSRLDSTGATRLLVQLRDVSRGIFRTQAQLMSLCDRGAVAGGYIGVTFENQSMILRREDRGSERTSLAFVTYPKIVDVAPGSPAEKAGVVRGDSIVEMGATDVVKGGVQFDLLLKPGAKLPVTVRRNGESKALSLVVAKRPNDMPDACSSVDRMISAAIQPVIIGLPEETEILGMLPRMSRTPRASGTYTIVGSAMAPPAPGSPEGPNGFTFSYTSGDFFAGAELRRLSADLADLTGVEDGVFVVSVARGSPAEQSGLKGGDVIVRANEMPVVRPDQVGRALRDSDDGSVKVVVVRKRAKQTLTIKAR